MEIEEFAWKAEYGVGLITVDKQHKRFLTILNELGRCIAEDKLDVKGKTIFFSLLQFADEYLLKEKMLVNSIADIDYSHFREKHKQFLAKLHVFKDEYNVSGSDQLFVDLYFYLKGMYPQYISYYTPSLINILKQHGME